MTDTPPNVWSFLMSLVTLLGVIGGPIVTWLLTRDQTRTVQADLAGNATKLEAIHDTATRTEVQVNGKSEEQARRIAELEAHLEDLQK